MIETRTQGAHRIRLIAIGLALAALAFAFRNADGARVLELCGELGASGLALALLPQLLVVLLETAAWRHALSAIGYATKYHALLAVRVASESLSLCLPGGALLAESAKVPLFARYAGLPATRAVVAIALRKYLVLAAQALYLLTAAFLLSQSQAGARHGLGTFVAGIAATALVLGAIAFSSRALFARGQLGASLSRLLARIPIRALRDALSRSQGAIRSGDHDLLRFFALPARYELGSVALGLVSWLSEALETFVLLHLLGVRLEFAEVAALEVTLSLVRSLVVVLPAGVGVQDAGYAWFFHLLGVDGAIEVAAAFTLLKRSKELLWASVGFALLARPRNKTRAPQAMASS